MASRAPKEPDSGGWSALAIAGLLHVAVLAAAPLVGARMPTAEHVIAIHPDTFDIEIDPPKPAAAAREQQAAESEARAKSVDVAKQDVAKERSPEDTAPKTEDKIIAPKEIVERSASDVAPRVNDGAPVNDATKGDAPKTDATKSDAPKGSSGDEYGPPPSGPIVGVPGVRGPIWSIPGVITPPPPPSAAPTIATGPKPVDQDIAGQVLSGGLQKKDRASGVELPAAGAVASAVANAVRSSDAPPDSKATFEVKLGADGKVLGVKVVSVNGGNASSWDRAAKSAAGALASKPLQMTGEAASHGATVTVKIESKQQFAAGSKQKVDLQPICAEDVVKQLMETMGALGGNAEGHGPIMDPGVSGIAPGGGRFAQMSTASGSKLCFIPIGIAGKGDLSNVNTHAQTIVSSKFTVNIPGQKVLEDVKQVDQRAPWSPDDPNKVKIDRPWMHPPKKKKTDGKAK